jgi:hypothetical protein
MASRSRESFGDVTEFLLLLGERLVEAAYRVRVEAIKAVRIGRLRTEMVMLRRERRTAIYRLGQAALAGVQDGRVTDPVLAAAVREVEDVSAALEAKADEAGRVADLPDDAVLDRPKGRAAREPNATEPGEPARSEPEADAVAEERPESRDGDRPLGAIPVIRKDRMGLADEL